MKQYFLKYWESNPLRLIIILALLVRLLAVIFSKGYGMSDDHFTVIEVSQSWVEGNDIMNWFSKSPEDNESGRSFLYPGMHYYLFKGLESIGLYDPQGKMYLVRLIHVLFSLLTVYYGYKISEKLSGIKTARQVGLLLALLWIIPSMSARNLIEMVVIPLLTMASWYVLISEESRQKWWLLFAAGLLVGIAFPIRYQTLFFSGGIAIALFIRKKYLNSIVYTLGMFTAITLVSGCLEWFLWGYPFGKLAYYIKDNIANADNYSTLAWYTYILQLLIIFFPPVSFFIFFGQFKVYKKYFLLFLPTMIFLIFHSYFPNKQERFIFTMFPFIIIMGLAGWNEILATSSFWQNKKKFIHISWIIFWSLNSILLCVFVFSYSKRARVEAMYYLSDKKVTGLVIEHTTINKDLYVPKFYLNHQWPDVIFIDKGKKMKTLKLEIDSSKNKNFKPSHVLFLDNENLSARVDSIKTIYPALHLIHVAEPSLLDWALYKMNPVNINQAIYIYQTQKD